MLNKGFGQERACQEAVLSCFLKHLLGGSCQVARFPSPLDRSHQRIKVFLVAPILLNSCSTPVSCPLPATSLFLSKTKRHRSVVYICHDFLVTLSLFSHFLVLPFYHQPPLLRFLCWFLAISLTSKYGTSASLLSQHFLPSPFIPPHALSAICMLMTN